MSLLIRKALCLFFSNSEGGVKGKEGRIHSEMKMDIGRVRGGLFL